MTSNVALIAVDVQYDFLPGGELAVPDGDQILGPLAAIAAKVPLVIASRDWHPDNHFSFSEDPQYVDQSWPPHCIQGSKGARLFPSVRKAANFIISKGMDKNGPDAYSAFAGRTLRPVTTLREILEGSPIDTIIVAGLALDYCVKYTAFDANALGYKTIVPLDATRPVNEDNVPDLLEDFEQAGIEVVETVEL